MTRTFFLPTLVLSALLIGCSGAPKEQPKTAEKKQEAPPEPVSGNTAFFRMFTAARGWAADIEILRCGSIHLEGVPRVPGKAAAWQVTFLSPSLGKSRSYTYSVIEAEGNLHKGVFAGLEETYTGPRGPIKPFIVQAVKVDTTTAYETALAKGLKAKEYAKAHPDLNISFVLENNNQFPGVTWRVIWGDSVSASGYSVYVDASTGEYLKTAR